MLYKFRSKAAGDVIMLGPNGDQVMRILDREPAAKGIFEVADMPAIVSALKSAVAADEAARAQAGRDARDEREAPAGKGDGVTLRQRVWPLIEMLERSHGAREVITWGT
jgi:hypothetical protein